MLTMTSFKKSLIVEQFQWNYLKTQDQKAGQKSHSVGVWSASGFVQGLFEVYSTASDDE